MGTHSVAWWQTLVVVVAATATDLRSRRIPNWLVLPFSLAGIGISAWLHGWQGVEQSLAGMAVGAVVFGLMFVAGGMGMGDVKLCAAIGAWIGPWQLFVAMVITALAGGIMALGWALHGGFLAELLRGSGDLVWGWRKRGWRPPPEMALTNPRARKMPYAPAIAVGTLISFFAR